MVVTGDASIFRGRVSIFAVGVGLASGCFEHDSWTPAGSDTNGETHSPSSSSDDDGDSSQDPSEGHQDSEHESGDSVESTCAAGMLRCEGHCIDPLTNPEWCGASEDCTDDPGERCEAAQTCMAGVCVDDDCEAGRVRCDGACVDPATSTEFCGATGTCEGEDRGQSCVAPSDCIDGICTDGQSLVWNLSGPETAHEGDSLTYRVRLTGELPPGGSATLVVASRPGDPNSPHDAIEGEDFVALRRELEFVAGGPRFFDLKLETIDDDLSETREELTVAIESLQLHDVAQTGHIDQGTQKTTLAVSEALVRCSVESEGTVRTGKKAEFRIRCDGEFPEGASLSVYFFTDEGELPPYAFEGMHYLGARTRILFYPG